MENLLGDRRGERQKERKEKKRTEKVNPKANLDPNDCFGYYAFSVGSGWVGTDCLMIRVGSGNVKTRPDPLTALEAMTIPTANHHQTLSLWCWNVSHFIWFILIDVDPFALFSFILIFFQSKHSINKQFC